MQQKKDLFEDMDMHLLEDEKPSEFFAGFDQFDLCSEYPFTMLSHLKNAQQSPLHHPEGNVWNHTMLVIDEAAKNKRKSSDIRAFMWAALLHDIGKPDTTKTRKGKITSYDHDKLGAKMAREFLEEFYQQEPFIEKVSALVRWHMQILYVVKSLPFADVKNMKEQISINDVALLGLCDRLGRVGADTKKEKENINIFIKKCII